MKRAVDSYSQAALSSSGGDELLAKWGAGIVTGSLLLVVLATLFPFDFSLSNRLSLATIISKLSGWGTVDDWSSNILLFVPFGLGLASLLQTVSLKTAAKIAVVLIISAGVSGAVEILQLFLPSKFPAFADIAGNSLGGVAGFCCFRLWKVKILTFLLALVKGRRQYLSFNKLTASLIGYFVLACLVLFILNTTSRLDNWDESFALLIGNEYTGDRPWRGSLSELIIADRAISPAEVERAFSEVNYWRTLGASLIGYYQLGGEGNYQDQTSKLPDLSWRTPEALVSQNSQTRAKDDARPQVLFSAFHNENIGVFLSPDRWLETKDPATFMIDAIRKTSQFTLSATVAAAEKWQTGPARIISLSGNPYVRNFTLGQERSDLIVRLRTRFSGENGANPELIIPNVFADTEVHHIVVVYDGRYFRLYVDKTSQSHFLEMIDVAIMNPAIVVQSLFSLPLSQRFMLDLDLANTSAYKILFLALIFIPMGALLSLIPLVMGGNKGGLGLLIVGWTFLPAITLEGIFASVGSSGMRLGNILLGSGISTMAMLTFWIWTTWLFNQPTGKGTNAEVASLAG